MPIQNPGNFNIGGGVGPVIVNPGESVNLTLNSPMVVLMTANGSDAIVNLPPAASCPGKIFMLKRTDNGILGSGCGVNADASDTIENSSQLALLGGAQAGEAFVIASDGVNTWRYMAHQPKVD